MGLEFEVQTRCWLGAGSSGLRDSRSRREFGCSFDKDTCTVVVSRTHRFLPTTRVQELFLLQSLAILSKIAGPTSCRWDGIGQGLPAWATVRRSLKVSAVSALSQIVASPGF